MLKECSSFQSNLQMNDNLIECSHWTSFLKKIKIHHYYRNNYEMLIRILHFPK